MLLLKVSASDYMKMRVSVADFAFFATFLEPIMADVSLNSPLSEILYFIDKLLVFIKYSEFFRFKIHKGYCNTKRNKMQDVIIKNKHQQKIRY